MCPRETRNLTFNYQSFSSSDGAMGKYWHTRITRSKISLYVLKKSSSRAVKKKQQQNRKQSARWCKLTRLTRLHESLCICIHSVKKFKALFKTAFKFKRLTNKQKMQFHETYSYAHEPFSS